ncbi:unnamed protein product [Cuscuta epithymum]|uniref:Uncharacterized protein n=1 Tax=Cuscuta epithymum TaxID=186058 RepID=A0AAV0F122_9ASTE|nr:unnamed protein product [Cuscuta epithymum]
MEALIQELFTTSNELVYNHHSKPVDPRYISGQRFFSLSSSSSFLVNNSLVQNESGTKEEEEEDGEGDSSAATLKYIRQMLMEEEDLENQPCMFRDCMALQATEKHLSDVLNGTDSPPGVFSWSDHLSNSLSSDSSPFECQNSLQSLASRGGVEETDRDHSPSNGKRNHEYSSPETDPAENQRNNKQLAAGYLEEPELLDDTYYDALFCPSKKVDNSEFKAGGRNRRGKKKAETKKEFVDLRGLLTQCAQSMANYEIRAANETLKRIRLHSSSHGNETERMAFYLANALEARSNGTGTSLYASNHPNNISAADIVKAYQMYINAIPFKVVSGMIANKHIRKLTAGGATSLHIIDFGILYGFHWPCLIQGLSMRPGGPPTLRITGIDFPQPGFRPEERVNATGVRLEKYCKRFNVPFEFKAIARKWESITLEDLKINRDCDVLVVNCSDRLGNVLDETVVPNSPRDMVLNLIKNINPDMFIHGVVNGTYNAPFFDSRFREALFHFSSLFDMFEVTVPSEDKDRLLFEEMVLGTELLNVIACEGTQRVERPETYKQWQTRSLRAGFQQLPLDQEIVKFVKEKVKLDYNKNFSVEEDGNWLLQGWKGRVHHAVSCWKPNNN